MSIHALAKMPLLFVVVVALTSRSAEANRGGIERCSTSWLIAARKRVLDCCAISASCERSATRCSSVFVGFQQRALACCSR